MAEGDLDEGLLDHLVVEFGGYHGRRAVEFLRSAHALMSLPAETVPCMADTIAYCLREAMKAIPESQATGGGGQWRTTSREVVKAKDRLQEAINADQAGETELAFLLDRINDMARTHEEASLHQGRLIAVVINRTGAQPLSSGTEPVRVYQDLVSRLDTAVHRGGINLAQALQLWNECLAILKQLFLPPAVRHRELEELANIQSPTPEDLTVLMSLLASPHHLQHFLSKLSSPGWIEALAESSLLDPPQANVGWPFFAAVAQLKDTHPAEIAAVLDRMFDKFGSSPYQAVYIAHAAHDLGVHGHDLLRRAAKTHRATQTISYLAISAAAKADPANQFVYDIADYTLSFPDWDKESFFPDPLMKAMVEGLNNDNYLERIRLLCYKIRKIPSDNHERTRFGYNTGMSLDEVQPHQRRAPFNVLIKALRESLTRASEWASYADLRSAIQPLPDDVRARVNVWLLGNASSVGIGEVIAEITNAVATRYPTGLDLVLVDRVVTECEPGEYRAAWLEALGTPPTAVELGTALSQGSVPARWRQAFYWSALLPPEVTTAWTAANTIMTGAYGQVSRAAFEARSFEPSSGSGQSPLSEADLRAMPTDEATQWIAAWRPDPSQWLVSARELARTLEEVVKSDTERWGQTPMATAVGLHHPTYIAHYLQGLSGAAELSTAPVGELVDLILFTYTSPWPAVSLGDSTFDYDPDWRGAQQAGIDLIKAMAMAGLDMRDRRDELWALLNAEATQRQEPSGVSGDKVNPLESAMNRPCTRALEAVLRFLGYEFRLDGTVRPQALELLTSLLDLDGDDGLDGRSILAAYINIVRYIAADWVEQNTDKLFGAAAPSDLGQRTVDLMIEWNRPLRWFLEGHAGDVKKAVKRGAKRALDHYLVAMLWQIPGYSVADAVGFLCSTDKLSDAGQALGHLLREDDNAERINVATSFWKQALAEHKNAPLAGFGWLTEVAAMDDETWAQLTSETVTAAKGNLDWAHKTAERAAQAPQSARTLSILNELVRGQANDWDRRLVIEEAIKAIKKASELADAVEYQRLHTTLLERGITLD